jgi:uncharacterized coiled-coil DUF342 family protein
MKLLKKTNSREDTLQHLNQDLILLNSTIDSYNEEIKFLEELLVTTSGPATDLIEEIKSHQKTRDELNFKYSAVMKQIQELRDVS